MFNIAVGIVLYKTSKDDLYDLLNSIVMQDKSSEYNSTILIKSNDGTNYTDLIDNFKNTLAENRNEIYLYGDCSNCGFGSGHNKLINYASDNGFDYYVGCNPDGRLHHKAFSRFANILGTMPSSTLYEFLQFPEEHPKTYDHFTGETAWASGACFAAKVDLLVKLGGFDENIRMYCEDVDLSWRVKLNGGKCIVLQKCLFYHDLTDRRDRQTVRIEMLKSGRYLAWKWKSSGFQDIMETELVRIGVADDVGTLPPILGNQIDCPDEKIRQIAEFRRLFSFSPTRW